MRPQSLRRGVLAALLLTSLTWTVRGRADDVPIYEEASRLRGTTWVLWIPFHDAAAAEINTASGLLRPIDISAFTYPWRFLAVPDGDRRAWLYALDQRGDDEVVLARIRLEGGGGAAPSLASRDLTAAAQSSSVKNDLITLSEWRTCFQETMDTTDEESYKNSFKKITAKGNAFLDLKLQLQKAKQEWKDARRPKKGGGTTTTPSSKKAAKAAAKPKAAKRKVDSQVLWD